MRRKPNPPSPDSGVRARILDDVRAESRSGRTSLFIGLLAVATFVFVAAFSVYQATSEQRTAALLQSGIATVTDVDALLDERLPEVRAEASNPEIRDVTIPAFPIPITFTRDEILESSDSQVRALLLQRAAAAVYANGLEAFDTTGNQTLGLASAEGLLNRLLGQLTSTNHDRAGTTAFVALLVATFSGVLAVASSRGYGTLRGAAIAVAVGALPGLVLAAAAVYGLGRVGGSDPFAREITALLQALFEVPRRNYFVVTLAAAFLAGCAYAIEFASRRYLGMRPVTEEAYYQPAFESAFVDAEFEPSISDEASSPVEGTMPATSDDEEVAG